jgi:formamidopyrimidine-DNA glycosylase
MPELPEVETLACDLRKTVVGRTITDVWVSPDAPRLVQAMPVAAFCDGLRGRRIEGVERRGKFLLIALDGGLWWAVHRRMSGNFLLRPQEAPDDLFLRARFRLDDDHELRFIDLRKFGTMWFVDDPAPLLAGLGPEPLDGAFTEESLGEALKKRSAPVKTVLLDQAVVAGMGNLYADEALWYAQIHPLLPANALKPADVSRLREGIVRALEQGLRNLGSSIGHEEGGPISLRDHVNLDGEPGANQEHVVAYGREGKPCLRCGTPIERLRVSNRSAHFCPKCQPRPRARRKPAARRAKVAR